MRRVNIQPEAAAEVREAASWYESQRPGLGLEFLLELDAAIERAAESPSAYAPQYAGVRRVLSRLFPYAIYFFMYEGDVIEVIAVLHQHRAPAFWRSRAR